MNREEIFKEIRNIFRMVFDDDMLEIGEDTSSEDIEDWDSLEHINLIVAMEKKFDIDFDVDEVSGLNNVGEMADLIAAKKMNEQV